MQHRLGIALDGARIEGDLSRLRPELEWLLEQGCNWVELPVQNLDLIRRGRLLPQAVAELQAAVFGLPLRLTVHAPDSLNLMAPPDELPIHLASLHSCIDLAALLSAPVLVVHPGRFVPEERFGEECEELSPEAAEALVTDEVAMLRELGDHAGACHVQIGLENVRPYPDGSPYCYAEHLTELAEQVRRVDRPAVGATLDLGHAHLASRLYETDLTAGVAAVAPLVRHVHLSDNYGVASYSTEKAQGPLLVLGRGDMHAPPGFGDAPLRQCLGALNPYGGAVILELRSRFRRYYAQALQDVAAMLSGREDSRAFR